MYLSKVYRRKAYKSTAEAFITLDFKGQLGNQTDMKIASWNINSINARMHALKKWLEAAKPDVVCLQETKTVDDGFPRLELEALGYNVAVYGQKSYNGVAILSKKPFEEIRTGLPGDETDAQARYIEALIMGEERPFRVASIYLPNGNPVYDTDNPDVFSEKYKYKLGWMERLRTHALNLKPLEEAVILAGDYNVIPGDKDTHDPQSWQGDAAFRPETHARYRALLNIGLVDGFEQLDGRAEQFTFWDYQGGAWPRNKGIRIDHLLLSAQAADILRGVKIDRDVREVIKPSDHVPII